MPIYTKGGDRGTTSLLNKSRVSKSSLRIELSGTVDELNSALGVARQFVGKPYKEHLLHIQSALMNMGGEISVVNWNQYSYAVTQEMITGLESWIDQYIVKLPKPRKLIIPGSTKAAAFTHMARTICRRAERVAVALHEQEPLSEYLLIYLNRLSDLLFVYAALHEGVLSEKMDA